MRNSAIGFFALPLLAACAQQPAAITPVSMGDTYATTSCSSAKKLYAQELARVPALVKSQKQAVTGDAIGVFLLLLPVSSLTGGDLEGEIAATKGKLLALSGRLDTCNVPYTPAVWG